MNKLDELFQEKLTNHSVVPSPEAWQKIEAGLSKKTRPLIWLRWAAVFLLGGLLLSVLWLRSPETPSTITESRSVPESPRNDNQKQAFVEKKQMNRTQVKKRPARKKPAEHPMVQQEPGKEALAVIDKAGVVMPASETVVVQTSPAQTQVPIVLVYTLDSIEPSAITPSALVATAGSDKKDSSLKRVLEFASTLKNSDSPLDNLRNAKEELFALDFKKKTNGKKQ